MVVVMVVAAGALVIVVMVVAAGALVIVVMVVAAGALFAVVMVMAAGTLFAVVMMVAAGALMVVFMVMAAGAFVIMFVVVTAGALFAVFMVMAAGAFVIVVMMVAAGTLVIVVVVVTAGALVIVMIMVVAATAAVLVVVVMVMLQLVQQLIGQRMTGHGLEDLVAVQLIPGGCDDGRIGVVLAQQLDHGVDLFGGHVLGTAEQDGTGIFDLIGKELAKILEADLAAGTVDDGNRAAQLHLDFLGGIDDGLGDIRQLADARGLDDHTVGVELGDDLLEGFAEVADQRAADAARVHFGNFYAGLLEETAVDADLAELVLDEDDLFALEGFVEQLFDEGSLAGTEKTGDDVDSCHIRLPFCNRVRFSPPFIVVRF